MPSFLHAEGLTVECPALGEITVDVAYGGNFYAIVEPQENFRDMADHSAGDLIAWSPVLRAAAERELLASSIPRTPASTRLSHMLWTGAPHQPEADARNAVFYGDKAIDRSPCGTGTSARMAQLARQGQAEGRRRLRPRIDHRLAVQGPRRERRSTVGGKPAIIPSIAGWARQTGLNTIFIDDRDPFAHGFVVA